MNPARRLFLKCVLAMTGSLLLPAATLPAKPPKRWPPLEGPPLFKWHCLDGHGRWEVHAVLEPNRRAVYAPFPHLALLPQIGPGGQPHQGRFVFDLLTVDGWLALCSLHKSITMSTDDTMRLWHLVRWLQFSMRAMDYPHPVQDIRIRDATHQLWRWAVATDAQFAGYDLFGYKAPDVFLC